MSCAGSVPEGGGEAKAAAEKPQEKEKPTGSLSVKPEPKKLVPAFQILPYPEKEGFCVQAICQRAAEAKPAAKESQQK